MFKGEIWEQSCHEGMGMHVCGREEIFFSLVVTKCQSGNTDTFKKYVSVRFTALLLLFIVLHKSETSAKVNCMKFSPFL